MYKSFDMIVLTRSSKYKDYCVAGIEIPTGKFIRLVTDNERTHGALSYRDLIMDNGCNAHPLDVVRVNNAQYYPGATQRENYQINQNERIQYLYTTTARELSQYNTVESQRGIFNAFEPIIQPVQAKKLDHSLELVRVNNLKIYTESKNGKNRTKADFIKDDRQFKRFSVTDPSYYGDDGSVNRIKEALVVCSIAEDEWALNYGYYIFIAAIFPIFPDMTIDRIITKEKQQKPSNAGKPWLKEDDERLLALYTSGMSVGAIAEQFGRTKGAIQSRLVKHGIADNYTNVPEYHGNTIVN